MKSDLFDYDAARDVAYFNFTGRSLDVSRLARVPGDRPLPAVLLADGPGSFVGLVIAEASRVLPPALIASGEVSRLTYSPSVDMGYIELVPVGPGEVRVTDPFEGLPGNLFVALDFDKDELLRGIELDSVSMLLGAAVLEGVQIVD
jgi:hypothetical protein